MIGKIFDIKRFAFNDGPGIRTTVFFKGCSLQCIWCHNPESINPNIIEVEQCRILDEKKFYTKQKIGKEITSAELLTEIKKDRSFFNQSGGGVTFSGGEPLMQVDFLQDIASRCKDENIHVTLDTSGFCSSNNLKKIIQVVDLFLYDIKIVDEKHHKQFTGVTNEKIKDNLELLVNSGKEIIIRIPVIPNITDTSDNISNISEMLKSYNGGISEIHLLPFHNIGEAKYERFNIENKFKGFRSLTKDDLKHLKKELDTLGIEVKIGG